MTELFLWSLAGVGLLVSGSLLWRRLGGPAQGPEAALLAPPEQGFAGLQVKLRILNIQLRPLLFIAGLLLSSVAVWIIFLSLFPAQRVLAIIAGLAFVPVTLLTMSDLVAWRSRLFETALVDVVDLMHAAAAGGTPPLLALQVAAQASRGYVRQALEDIVRRIRLGATVDEACKPLLGLYSSEGVRLFANTLSSRWHAGGDFEGLLQALGGILRERSFYRQRLQGQLSGARYALLFAAFFPYILIPFFLWKEPSWLAPLSEHAQGPAFVLAAVLCQILGFLWMRRILRSDDL
ncbi:type II secretion system F family protein [Pseudomonas benzenivorans]|uniref:Type II secretion system F family protein n=1 Tax=Pseudomonas benzenivorans TaxID=556533 RepID=A0ABY5H8K3_9PSED|nr:type II secretion system F family protein [Pseudomonas benzenivorans]UTW08468.1 type II secretion system F family protein [Pseudomonas benzenivorans]